MNTKQEATAKGKSMLAMMDQPKDWRVDVWENLGWHYCLEHRASGGLLTVWPFEDGIFSAMLSLNCPRAGDIRWSNNYHSKDPNKAVQHVIRRAEIVLAAEQAAFNKIAP